MSICYDLQKWTLLTFAIVAVSLSIGLLLINFAHGQEVQWLNWEDPDKQFSLQYPSNWTLIPRENRFDEQDVSFNIVGNSTMLTINVYNTTSTDLVEIMDRAAETNNLPESALKSKLFEGPDYVSYTVSGEPAGSIIWTNNNVPFMGKLVWQNIASIVGDKFVGIIYASGAPDFDKYSPQVEKVIQSIKVK
jgi:hypothetical protein